MVDKQETINTPIEQNQSDSELSINAKLSEKKNKKIDFLPKKKKIDFPLTKTIKSINLSFLIQNKIKKNKKQLTHLLNKTNRTQRYKLISNQMKINKKQLTHLLNKISRTQNCRL